MSHLLQNQPAIATFVVVLAVVAALIVIGRVALRLGARTSGPHRGSPAIHGLRPQVRGDAFRGASKGEVR